MCYHFINILLDRASSVLFMVLLLIILIVFTLCPETAAIQASSTKIEYCHCYTGKGAIPNNPRNSTSCSHLSKYSRDCGVHTNV